MATTQELVFISFMVLLHSAQSRHYYSEHHKHIHPQVDSDCNRQGICIYVSNYPKKLAELYLKEYKSKNITKYITEKIYDEQEYKDSDNICSEKEKVIYPKAAKDKNDTWKFILNGNLFQGFVVEICKEQCPRNTYNTQYDLKCTQKFEFKKMMYLNMEHGNVTEDYFKVPRCCSCSLVFQ